MRKERTGNDPKDVVGSELKLQGRKPRSTREEEVDDLGGRRECGGGWRMVPNDVRVGTNRKVQHAILSRWHAWSGNKLNTSLTARMLLKTVICIVQKPHREHSPYIY